jgi:hypothetical protein
MVEGSCYTAPPVDGVVDCKQYEINSEACNSKTGNFYFYFYYFWIILKFLDYFICII